MAVEIKLGNKEKRLLVMVAVVFVFAFIGPGFLGNYALQYRSTQQGLKSDHENQINETQVDLDSIEDRKEILRRYINRYRRLVEEDVLSLPDPVSLVQHMKDITTERKQNATQFQFGRSALLGANSSSYTDGSSIGVNVYPLDIEMGMLHDMDIFMFIESLETKVPNIGFPVQCSIELVSSDFAVVNRENFDGICRINWYAVTDPNQAINVGEDKSEAETSQG